MAPIPHQFAIIREPQPPAAAKPSALPPRTNYPGRAPENPTPDPIGTAVQTWQQDRTPDNAAQMLRSLSPVFDRALRQYVPGQDTPVLRAHLKHLALQALPQYDPQRGQPETFLRPYLQRIQRLAVQQSNIISVPERLLMERQAMQAASRELEDRLGRVPSSQELADHVGIPIKRLAHIRRAHVPLSESQATRLDEQGDPVEPAVQQAPTQAVEEFVYDSLDDKRDQLILELAAGLHGYEPHSINEIAQKLQLTASAVSQRAQRIQQQLNEMQQANLFL